MDFSRPVIVDTGKLDWVSSPRPGVERRALEREQEESGLTTSIVRYAAGASFSRHTHTGGEEILVLEGTFSDESGDFPQGTYVRNPPGTQHTPFSRSGCVIFVKLCQMKFNGEVATRINTHEAEWQLREADGYSFQTLYESEDERVQLVALSPNSAICVQERDRGLEILTIDGELEVNNIVYAPMTWMRFPVGAMVSVASHAHSKYWWKHWASRQRGQPLTIEVHRD